MFLSRIRKENLSNVTYISPSVLWRPTTASFLNPTAYFSHLNYTTSPPRIVEQIVNILQADPPLSLRTPSSQIQISQIAIILFSHNPL